MLKPLAKRIVLKPKEVEETTASGFVLPSSAQEKQQIGEVVAVGPEIEAEDGVKVGDQVIYKSYSATEIEDQGEKYIIIELKEALAIIE
ncbi:co-chaperone GroES [Facklamia miroungae]|uniref:Co-chaperonin GroES n=1 Tax=Facklamia miroungae TaxID=120956 RepID=A0A1G7S2A8_9LACT|nr:co-chaperone GroES [Facklamia miroungae]NKZ29217.1 co-chaperone GroES [Facklamia miroungae]SDG16230.1 chaperonin GroES [Facklamia miroungae]